jgi:N-methylhydantoinase A/oxoprolinase/acetone carboxylase beta subunit
MAAVLVPAHAGVLSAVGLLTSPRQRDLVRSWPTPRHLDGLDAALAKLAHEAASLVGPGAATTTAVDCRYEGQSHEITVPTVADFHEAHRLRNGFARPDAAIEVIALRATAALPSDLHLADLPAPVRAAARGPLTLAEPDCTIWIPDGWSAEPGTAGALVLRRTR